MNFSTAIISKVMLVYIEIIFNTVPIDLLPYFPRDKFYHVFFDITVHEVFDL